MMDLAAEIHQRADHIILFGEAASLIYSALDSYEKHNFPYTLERTGTLSRSHPSSRKNRQEGDVYCFLPRNQL